MSKDDSILTVVISTDPDSLPTKRTVACCTVDGVRVVVKPPDQVAQAVADASEEFIHLAPAGLIFLPDFYSAALSTLHFKGGDYAMVSSLRFEDGKTVVRDGSGDLKTGQLLVRCWALRERGVPKADFDSWFRAFADEYRGAEVPHVLVVE
jgi:hypothetical protein